jgi:hypothetical protein
MPRSGSAVAKRAVRLVLQNPKLCRLLVPSVSVVKPLVRQRFDDNGRIKLARLSSANKSKPLPFMLDGKVLMAPIVTDPILDGVAQITGMFTLTEAEILAKRISGKPPLPDSL